MPSQDRPAGQSAVGFRKSPDLFSQFILAYGTALGEMRVKVLVCVTQGSKLIAGIVTLPP